MTEQSITIKKYTYAKQKSNYIIYLIPEEHNLTSVYIQKEQYGLMSLAIGLDFKELEIPIEDYIEENIEDWIESCEMDIDVLERE